MYITENTTFQEIKDNQETKKKKKKPYPKDCIGLQATVKVNAFFKWPRKEKVRKDTRIYGHYYINLGLI